MNKQEIAVGILLSVTLIATQASDRPLTASLQHVLADMESVSGSGDVLTQQQVETYHAAAEQDARLSVPEENLRTALEQRKQLLARSVTVSWHAQDGTEFPPWVATPTGHLSWIKATLHDGKLSFSLNPEHIAASMEAERPSGIPLPQDSTISAVEERYGVLHAVTDQPARDGYDLRAQETAALVAEALMGTGTALDVSLPILPARVINASDQDLGPLQLLSTGKSNFAGSGKGRIFNVRRGLSDYIDGVIVPAGDTFSFNAAVNNMVPISAWQDALVIMNASDLVSSPGGGICQVATTVYRAALQAGLPIAERANHSLYVTYYEKYGAGLDATIFPHKQDFTFVNDTGQDVLLQSYYDGFEARVNMFGAPDGRKVDLAGPYFDGSVTDDYAALLGRPLKKSEIGWLQNVTLADGSVVQNAIVSRYNYVPKSLKEKFAQTQMPTLVSGL